MISSAGGATQGQLIAMDVPYFAWQPDLAYSARAIPM
jgi:hypothetical protein